MANGNGNRNRPGRAYTRGSSYDIGASTDPTGTTFDLPPFMSYDPSIAAEIRANQRGIQDINQDFRTQRKIDRQDYRQTKKDIQRTFKRGKQDLKFGAKQARRGFAEGRQDIRQTAQRGREDFRLQLADTFRKYGIQASNQAQASNQRGVGEGGSLAAGAAIREANMGRDVGKLELARQRQQEDIATALQRLGKDQREFKTEYGRSRTRLREDTRRDTKLSKRDFRRTRRQARRENNRANREAYFSQLDLTTQAIYNARQTNPGSFNKYGQRTNGGGGSGGGKKKGRKKKNKPTAGFSK